jgi:hypothetical protein
VASNHAKKRLHFIADSARRNQAKTPRFFAIFCFNINNLNRHFHARAGSLKSAAQSCFLGRFSLSENNPMHDASGHEGEDSRDQ